MFCWGKKRLPKPKPKQDTVLKDTSFPSLTMATHCLLEGFFHIRSNPCIMVSYPDSKRICHFIKWTSLLVVHSVSLLVISFLAARTGCCMLSAENLINPLPKGTKLVTLAAFRKESNIAFRSWRETNKQQSCESLDLCLKSTLITEGCHFQYPQTYQSSPVLF